MIELPLVGSNLVTYIDDEDYNLVCAYKWYLWGKYISSNLWNARTKKLEHLILHRLITNAKKGEIVHHKDRNTLNNCKSNLELMSAENHHTTHRIEQPPRRKGYKGVVCYQHYVDRGIRNPYKAQIEFNGRKLYLGMFKTEEEAARHYDLAAFELYGERAYLNFPVECIGHYWGDTLEGF